MTGTLPLVVNNLTVGFRHKLVFSDLSLQLRPKEFVTIMGENGAGKTVLIETMMGYHRPLTGSVSFWGRSLTGKQRAHLNRRIGWVISQREDYPAGLTVKEFFKLQACCQEQWDDTFAHHLLSSFQLDRDKSLNTLSLGEQSKVKLIKAMAFHPELLILDELTANLSPDSKRSILEALISHFTDRSLSVLYISHAKDEAYRLSDHIYWLGANGLSPR